MDIFDLRLDTDGKVQYKPLFTNDKIIFLCRSNKENLPGLDFCILHRHNKELEYIPTSEPVMKYCVSTDNSIILYFNFEDVNASEYLLHCFSLNALENFSESKVFTKRIVKDSSEVPNFILDSIILPLILTNQYFLYIMYGGIEHRDECIMKGNRPIFLYDFASDNTYTKNETDIEPHGILDIFICYDSHKEPRIVFKSGESITDAEKKHVWNDIVNANDFSEYRGYRESIKVLAQDAFIHYLKNTTTSLIYDEIDSIGHNGNIPIVLVENHRIVYDIQRFDTGCNQVVIYELETGQYTRYPLPKNYYRVALSSGTVFVLVREYDTCIVHGVGESDFTMEFLCQFFSPPKGYSELEGILEKKYLIVWSRRFIDNKVRNYVQIYDRDCAHGDFIEYEGNVFLDEKNNVVYIY